MVTTQDFIDTSVEMAAITQVTDQPTNQNDR